MYLNACHRAKYILSQKNEYLLASENIRELFNNTYYSSEGKREVLALAIL